MDNNKNSRSRMLIISIFELLVLLFLLWYFEKSSSPTLIAASDLWDTIKESSGGVITGITISILSGALILFIEYYTDDITKRIRGILDPTLEKINNGLTKAQGNINVAVAKLLDSIGSKLTEILVNISKVVFSILLFPLQLIILVLKIIWGLCVELANKFRAPKWYYQKDAIDPGLVEVSLAVTAVLIALPSIISADILAGQIKVFNIFRFLGEAIPTLTSISLLDRYAKGKGSLSVHILVSPLVDGPFFFLGWSIVIGFIFIAVVAFQLQS